MCPSLHLNLISISKLTKALNCCVVLLPNGCILQYLATMRIIGSGEQRGGLYYMKPFKKNCPTLFMFPTTRISDI